MNNSAFLLKNQTINCIKCNLITIEKTTDYFDACITTFFQNGVQYHKCCRNCKPEKFKNKPCLENSEHEEFQYLDLIAEIISFGNIKVDESNHDKNTRSLFGKRMKFNLKDSFPLLTTKKVFWRAVVEELLWFIRGSTNSNELSSKNINIWNDNASREYLDSKGFTDREIGDLGPVYGFQWRHSGAPYENMHSNYENKGIDQLKKIIETIKKNHNDRRMIMCSWNPIDIPKMALPPCHCLVQFYVANNELNCQLYQRSADMGLGVPFNIASYSLLTYLIAHVTDLEPGSFIHVLGDAHVYESHIEPLKEQLLRRPFKFPTLKLNKEKQDINDFTFEDIKLINYKYHPKIEMKLVT
jgi:thymidylate synthase